MLVKLVDIIKEAKGTKSFIWSLNKNIKYLPGQYFYFTLPQLKYKDSRGPTRHFTISSSPTEKGILKFTTRIRNESGFKKTLNDLKIGNIIEAEGPNGTFILDENSKGGHIFIAGGIGVTPFRSFAKYNIDKNLKDINLHLIYSNSVPKEITFRKELVDWSKSYKNLKVDMTITKPEKSKNWEGLTGRIDENMLKKLISDYRLPNYWTSGPPGLVTAMEKVLSKLNIPKNKIRSEKFTGY